MHADHFTIPMKEWGGAAGRTLIQGFRIHPLSGTRIVNQADDVTGQTEQDIVFRAHTAANKYLGAITVKRAGHGSSVGIESVSATSCKLWLGHEQQNGTGYVVYEVGQTGTAAFTKAAGLPRGDVSIDQGDNLLCLRRGNRYTGYSLSSVNAGQPEHLWDFTIPAWGKRFQGHLVYRGNLFVHRDIATKQQSMAHRFNYSGKQLGTLTTTGMGDEAEGFAEIDGVIYVVKRTGGNNANRVVECTKWLVIDDPKEEDPPVASYTLWRGVRVNQSSVPSLDAIAVLSGPNVYMKPIQGGFNRGGVAASAGTHDGGAAIDWSVAGWSRAQIDAIVRLARECGWAAWYRPYIKGLWGSHIHMIRVGDTTASAGAKAQVSAYKRGRNGLANNGKDDGPTVLGVNGEKFPTWAQSIHNPANKPKTLEDYLAELGPVKDVSATAINNARGTGKASRHVAQMQQWLNLWLTANQPKVPLLDVDGIWSKSGPTQDALDLFREKSLGWTGDDITGEVGPHSLTRLHDDPAVAAANPLPVREPWPATK